MPWETVAGAFPKSTLPLINGGDDEGLTMREFAEAIADAVGFAGCPNATRPKNECTKC